MTATHLRSVVLSSWNNFNCTRNLARTHKYTLNDICFKSLFVGKVRSISTTKHHALMSYYNGEKAKGKFVPVLK